MNEHMSTFHWLPFGAGPRICIGKNFSLLEQKLILVKLIQRFKMTLLKDEDVGIDSSKLIIITPHKFGVRFVPRSKCD